MPVKTNAKLTTKDFITITVAVLLLMTGIIISFYKDFEPELVVFILISFSFGLLSFLMIGKIEGKEISFMGIKISQVSGGFLIFIILLASFLGYKKITNLSDKKALELTLGESIQIGHPYEKSVWTNAAGLFKWFNPPLIFAVEDHRDLKMNWFKDDGFKLEILLIQSKDSTENSNDFTERLKRLKEFIRLLKEKYAEFNMNKHIKVRIFIDNYIPSQSFFISDKWADNDVKHSIFYLPSKDSQGRPTDCIITSSEKFYDILRTDFEKYWEKAGSQISLEKLLNTEITTATTRASLL